MVTTLLLAGVLVALLTLLVLVVRLINDIKTAQRVSQGNRTIHPNSEPWEPTPRLTKEPPVFGGDSATFKEWTFAMDMALRSLALPNAAQRVDYAAGFLTGNARLWLIAALEANQVFSDWPALKAALGDVYGPRHNEETSRMGLISAAQRGSLDAYIAAFTRLSLQVPEIDHHTRALLFVRGLVPHIQRQVMREHPRTLEQAVMAANETTCYSKFVVVFLDDILVFSKTWEDHQHHLQTVLETLRNSELYCKQSKCEFGVREVLFLGHKINGTSISPDPKKISAVETWPTPSSVTDVRKFLGFANYFRRFIDRHSTISRPLEEITGKNSRFEWSAARQKAFESLKSALLEAPVLQLADVEKSFMVETDASDFAVAGVLLQQGEDMDLHPVAYCSRKLSAAERNYTAAERETLAVVFALKCWRIYLFRHFDLMTDNMGVVYLRTKPTLTKREARWVEFLADYDFTVFHKPGKKNIADPLSRRPDLFSDSEIGGSSYPPNIQLNAIEHTLEINPDLAQLIVSGYKCDKDLAPIIRRLKNSSHDNLHDRYLLNETPGYLYLRSSPQNRLCIPKSSKLRLALLQEYHDCVTAGHPGRDRTYFRLSRYFYWPRMGLDVKAFVKSCDVCQRVKGGQLKTGLLQNLPVPSQPWADISMDFIMGLPRTDTGHDAIYVFVDRLTKCVHLAPTSSTIDAKGSADLYIQHVFRLHGLSSSIVCDRDPRFTAAFFQELFDRLGTKLAFSTANHPQTDGLTERVNRIVEDVLRAFVNHKQDNWDMFLPLCEFSINSATQSSTGNTPFFLNYGLNPRAPPDFLNPIQGGRDSADWLQARQDAVKIAQDALVAAQARQAFYADRTRVEGKLKVGDLVMVYRDFLLTPEARDRPSHKLRPKWFGPFPITHVVGPNAYKLKLPHTSRCHPVLNVSALRAYEKNAIPNRRQPTPPPITDLDGHARYVVENILSHRRRQNQLQYLVKWQGYSDATWEPEHYLLDESGNDIVPLQKYKTLASAR